MSAVDASLLCFATDLADEGIDVVLSNAQDRAGCNGLTIAFTYHASRDVFPHNPAGKVRYMEGGTWYFQPDVARYGKIRPHRVAHESVTARTIEAARMRGMAVRAWTIFLHADGFGAKHQDCVVRNAFGDAYATDLCPANPDVRAYVRALCADIASQGVEAIVAESLHYSTFDHGSHHERMWMPLDEQTKELLGLCFCEHCLKAAGPEGRTVHARVREALKRALNREPPSGDLDLDAYRTARAATVTSLVSEAREACGDAQLWMTGTSAPSLGLDLPRVAGVSSGISICAYAQAVADTNDQIQSCRDQLPESTPIGVILRPMHPDCTKAENLRAKVANALHMRTNRVDFYHYGFMPLEALDWIGTALASVS